MALPRFVSPSFHILTALGLAIASSACGGGTSSDGGNGNGNQSDAGSGGGSGGGGSSSGGSSSSSSSSGSSSGGGSGSSSGSSSGGTINGVVAVPLTACDSALVYVAPVTVGSQDFSALIDTGSTSFGLAGAGCTNCKVTPLYQPGASSTDQKKTAQSQFGSGSWSGEIFQDSVGFKSDPSVSMKLVSITSATSQNPGGFFAGTCGGSQFQGLLGFGRPAAAVSGTDPLMDEIVSQKSIPDVFATQLCDKEGTLWLGGFDSAATTGAPQYTSFSKDAASSYYYTVALPSISVGSATATLPSGLGQDAILDTGTSVILLADAPFNTITAAITADAGFKQVFGSAAATFFQVSQTTGLACGADSMTKAQLDAQLPKLTMTFGSSPAVVVDAVATESYLVANPNGPGWCNSLVSATEAGQQLPVGALIGAPGLRSSVIIFDRAKNQVGFAPHQACKTSARPLDAQPATGPHTMPLPRIRVPQIAH